MASKRTARVHIVVAQDDGGRWIASVSPMSMGAFPIGTKPVPCGGATREEAIDRMRDYVRHALRGDRVVFS